MHITFVLGCANMSGGARVVATHARGLSQRGHEVRIVSIPPRRPRFRSQFKALLQGRKGIGRQNITESHFDYTDVSHHVIDQCRPITDRDVPDADVVVATWWMTAEWVSQLSSKKGAKAYFLQGYETYYPPIYSERVKSTWRLPFHKIVISQWLADLAREKYGDWDVSLVPNSVDTAQFHASPRGKQARPTVGLVYAGCGSAIKGTDVMLSALEIAVHKLSGLRVIAFGQDDPSPRLSSLANGNYWQRPFQSKLREIYANCDAWLFGSRTDGFGLPILEAMACRTPVVGTPAGAAPELLTDGCGLLVRPEDPADMARKICEVCNFSDGEWHAMSDRAYRKATSYTWDDATDLFERALTRATESNATMH